MGKSRHTSKPSQAPDINWSMKQLIGSAVLCLLWLGLSCLALTPAFANEEMKLEVIQLSSSTAEQLIPLIKPFVIPGGTMAGSASQLIVKTTPANLQEIRTLLAQLDVPPKQLRISVTQDIDSQGNLARDQVSGRLGGDHGSVRLGDPRGGYGRDGASIRYGDGNGNVIGYDGARTRTSRANNNTHFVTTVEGRPAFIFTGESTPYSNRSYYDGPFGTYAQENIDLVQTDRGFYVTARVTGDQVQLDIATQLDQRPDQRNGTIQTRSTDTVASGRLGQWIPLGGARQTATGNQSGILARTRGREDSSYDVWVKVEVVN